MARVQITLSIPREMAQWLDSHPSIVASHLLQGEISKLMSVEHGDTLEANGVLTKKIESMLNRLNRAHVFLEKKGLIDEYIKDNAND